MKVPAPLVAQQRVLMGPGPSPVPPSVLAALALPTIGHLDPEFLRVMDEVRSMLQTIAGARSGRATAISATGSAGMETCLVNLLERGDRALVVRAGVFGTRMAEVARRAGAEVDTFDVPWGESFDVADLRAFAADRSYRIVACVHAETSTGVLQPLEGLRELADDLGALLVVDAVTSLGGVPVEVTEQGIDALYSGTQKCLSCPPGLSPVVLSDAALERVAARTTPVQSWYLDLSLIEAYWGGERAYHHTAPINMLFGLHEALRLCLEEGLEARYARHARMARGLWAGLEALDLAPRVVPERRLPQLTTVAVPDGVDEAALRRRLLNEFDLELGGGLGPMKGTTWRIGLMGAGATERHVHLCLDALAKVLERDARAATEAAARALAE
ncbi:Purine catabolism protein PucG [Planctomycetes bacterium Pla163]|uniref:Purine catabolism protein PucG n=1 Tax=Rohdeia mirabilis TaxID=2528008 RepID=A0A518CZ22_9BACT|nr:Purine catabolism protein PucG [Planctomycetes bacterium Pla163]